MELLFTLLFKKMFFFYRANHQHMYKSNSYEPFPSLSQSTSNEIPFPLPQDQLMCLQKTGVTNTDKTTIGIEMAMKLVSR